eukprot:365444-Chlamydomonas_euryale.AAC.7
MRELSKFTGSRLDLGLLQWELTGTCLCIESLMCVACQLPAALDIGYDMRGCFEGVEGVWRWKVCPQHDAWQVCGVSAPCRCQYNLQTSCHLQTSHHLPTQQTGVLQHVAASLRYQPSQGGSLLGSAAGRCLSSPLTGCTSEESCKGSCEEAVCIVDGLGEEARWIG